MKNDALASESQIIEQKEIQEEASGFFSLFDFKRPRSPGKVFGFYAGQVVISLLVTVLVGILVALYVTAFKPADLSLQDQADKIHALSPLIATPFSIVYCCLLFLWVMHQRKAWHKAGYWVGLLAAAFLAYIGQTPWGLLPVALALLRQETPPLLIPFNLEGFSNHKLAVRVQGFFRLPTLLIDDQEQPRQKAYLLKNDQGEKIPLSLKADPYDPVPRLKVGDKVRNILPPLRWYEEALTGIPYVYILVSGLAGIVLGALTSQINGVILRSLKPKKQKIMIALALDLLCLGISLGLSIMISTRFKA